MVSRILEHIFNGIDVSFNYNDLYDPKTRLKELFDRHKNDLGVLVYKDTRNETLVSTSISHCLPNGRQVFLATGTGNILKDAHQKAAEKALEVLNQRGISKNKEDLAKFYAFMRTDRGAI